jgi:hypothetical protein
LREFLQKNRNRLGRKELRSIAPRVAEGLPYPVDFEQMPGFGGSKATWNRGLTSKKPFVQTGFSVNKWCGAKLHPSGCGSGQF